MFLRRALHCLQGFLHRSLSSPFQLPESQHSARAPLQGTSSLWRPCEHPPCLPPGAEAGSGSGCGQSGLRRGVRRLPSPPWQVSRPCVRFWGPGLHKQLFLCSPEMGTGAWEPEEAPTRTQGIAFLGAQSDPSSHSQGPPLTTAKPAGAPGFLLSPRSALVSSQMPGKTLWPRGCFWGRREDAWEKPAVEALPRDPEAWC